MIGTCWAIARCGEAVHLSGVIRSWYDNEDEARYHYGIRLKRASHGIYLKRKIFSHYIPRSQFP